MATDGGSGAVWPVILAGGTGSRLWPLSRELYPKQFMALTGEATLLQETARRLAGPPFAPPLVLCGEAHRFVAAEQLRAAAIPPEAIVLEPAGRNTAPAIAVAALMLCEKDAGAVLLAAPADHAISDPEAFRGAVNAALPAAREGRLVTFGVVPQHPETGYGYIEAEGGDATNGVLGVKRFTEKPDAESAERMAASGAHYWNAGIFLMKAETYLRELETHAPEVPAAARAALEGSARDLDFLRLDAAAFAGSPSVSIDYAVMEKTDRAAVVPVDMGWSDLGSWAALWEAAEKDADGNALRGDVAAEGVRNSYLRTERGLLAAVDLEDTVVVVTDDAVLVAGKGASQDVKALVERLRAADRAEPMTHTTTHRPWGSFQSVDAGARFQVKRITVKPGGRLSLQKHAKRAEHWVVVEGTATVTRGDDVIELEANESTYIPIGMAHRLENRTEALLHLIEVQSGDYLGEDDIERLDDAYGRA